MLHFSDIEINKFQLNSLLNQREKKGLNFHISHEILCSSCNQSSIVAAEQYQLYLDRFNDIKLKGECNNCGNQICEVMPFGHSETFFRKAIQFRHKLLVT